MQTEGCAGESIRSMMTGLPCCPGWVAAMVGSDSKSLRDERLFVFGWHSRRFACQLDLMVSLVVPVLPCQNVLERIPWTGVGVIPVGIRRFFRRRVAPASRGAVSNALLPSRGRKKEDGVCLDRNAVSLISAPSGQYRFQPAEGCRGLKMGARRSVQVLVIESSVPCCSLR